MNAFGDIWENVVEEPVMMLGLGQPLPRFAAFAAVSAVAFNVWKPRGMFNSDGTARPWSVTAMESSDSTPLPWPVASALIGVMSVLFI